MKVILTWYWIIGWPGLTNGPKGLELLTRFANVFKLVLRHKVRVCLHILISVGKHVTGQKIRPVFKI